MEGITDTSTASAERVSERMMSAARENGLALDQATRRLVRETAEAAYAEGCRKREGAGEDCDSFAVLFDWLPVPIWRTDVFGDLEYANRAWLSFTGRPLAEERGEGWLDAVADDEHNMLQGAAHEAARMRRPFRFEYHLRRHDGVMRWVETQATPIYDARGEYIGHVGWTSDLTEHKQQEAQLAFMATHDALTGLPNRRMLEEPLKRAVARAKRGQPSGLLLLDVDNFKYYNDALGHLEGDQALINLALLLQTHLRSGDLLVRMGGDEFAVLLEGATVDEALDIAERMRDTASGEFVPHARDYGLSISLGLLMIDGGMDHRRLLGYADSAMYRAKESGRNRVMLHTPQDQMDAVPQDSTASMLRDAFRTDSFILHYQPVVRLDDGEGEYYEALVRLSSNDAEDTQLIQPADFLPAAERFGLAAKLTRWVVRKVVERLASEPEVSVSVNLSASDLTDATLADDVADLLARGGVEPHRLLFEVPESVVTQDFSAAEHLLEGLRAVGCRLVLEDFGRAFASLSMLRGLPVDHVKVDGSLVAPFEDESSQLALMSAVRALAATQGMRVVAECVENASELERVRKAGFEFAQGHGLMRPAPLKDR